MGRLYYEGEGVSQDYKESAKWYQLAADQANPFAQGLLGILYEAGRGVPQDYVLAYMWYNLAGSQGDKDWKKEENKLANKMTPSQIEKAKEMARNWKPKK